MVIVAAWEFIYLTPDRSTDRARFIFTALTGIWRNISTQKHGETADTVIALAPHLQLYGKNHEHRITPISSEDPA